MVFGYGGRIHRLISIASASESCERHISAGLKESMTLESRKSGFSPISDLYQDALTNK